MNQRDQFRGQGRRGEQRGGERGEQQRGGRERMQGASRDSDTWNPEPQWLQEDRQRRDTRGFDDEYDYGRGRYVASDTEQSGRGSYAGTGREWGESTGRNWAGRDWSEQDRAQFASARHGSGDQHRSQYGSPYAQSGRYPGGGYDNAYGGRDTEPYSAEDRGWNERDHGFSRSTRSEPFRGQHDYSTGYEAAQWDDQDFSGGYSSYGPFRVGTGMGVGTGGFGRERSFSSGESQYGSRGGWDLGTHQRDLVREGRSFRGLGPQNYTRPDERIRDDVYERLTDSHLIDARNILVEVNQGHVTLAGTVTERRMRYAAEDLVEGVMGVANINNQLKVQEPSAPTQGTGAASGESASGTSETKRH
jgi:osmotically-inducible protein OsmY